MKLQDKLFNTIFDFRRKVRQINQPLLGSYRNRLDMAIRTRILPQAEAINSGRVKVTLDTSDPRIEPILCLALSVRQRASLAWAVFEFIRGAAVQCINEGRCYYEFVQIMSAPHADVLPISRLRMLNPESTIDLLGQGCLVMRNTGFPTATDFVFIPSNQLLKFTAPSLTRTNLNEVHHWLRRAEDAELFDVIVKFDEKTKQPMVNTAALKHHHRNIKMAVAYISYDFGFDPDSPSEYTTAFFTTYRYLRLYRYLILLREAILRELNSMLVTLGQQQNFSATLSIDGLTSLSDIDDIIDGIKCGKLSLKDAYLQLSSKG